MAAAPSMTGPGGPGPRRLLLAGDTHHDLAWFDHLVGRARALGAEKIVQLGDFGFFPRLDFGREFLAGVTDLLAQSAAWAAAEGDRPLEVLFIRGNHDDVETLDTLPVDPDGLVTVAPHLRYAPNGSRWDWHGVGFAVAGGAVSVDRAQRTEGSTWWRAETLSYRDAYRLTAGGPADVLLAHDCPAGVAAVEGYPGKADTESAAHRGLVRDLVEALEPALVVHGHYHFAHDSGLAHAAGTSRVVGLGRNEDTVDGAPVADSGASYALLELPRLGLTWPGRA